MPLIPPYSPDSGPVIPTEAAAPVVLAHRGLYLWLWPKHLQPQANSGARHSLILGWL